MNKIKHIESEWYNLRPILGYANWALFFILLGGRETGKSYSVTNFFVDQFVNENIPFTWLRLTEKAANKLLVNNAEKLIDPDIRRKYNLDIVTRGNNVYQVTKRSEPDKNNKTKILEKKLMARVYAVSTFYNDKGSIFDKDFITDLTMRYNIGIDEFEREKGEKNTFDIVYSLVNQLENLCRSTKQRTKIFMLGNTLEEASDVLCAFDFIPETWGTFKLVKNKKILIQYLKELDDNINDPQTIKEIHKKYEKYNFGKRAVIQNIAPSDAYAARRKNTIASILLPNASTFTNSINTDNTLIDKSPLIKPIQIIKFNKSQDTWFTVWNNNTIAQYNKEKCATLTTMRPYLDALYSKENAQIVYELFNSRCYTFHNLITFKQFQHQLQLLKPSK